MAETKIDESQAVEASRLNELLGCPRQERDNVTDAERLKIVELFLQVVRERLDCLKEYDYVTQCDALEILETNLDAAIAECNGQ